MGGRYTKRQFQGNNIKKIKNIKTKSILEKHFNNVSIELVSKVNFG